MMEMEWMMVMGWWENVYNASAEEGGNGAKNLTSVEIVNFKFIFSELLVAEVSSGRTLETGNALQFKS